MRALPSLICLLLISCHPRPDKARHRDSTMAMYTVQWGDTLEWIAWDFDVPGGYPTLAKLNGLRNPDLIFMGQHLRIPRNGYATEELPPWPAMDPIEAAPRACTVERLPQPQPAQVPGCATAACVTIDGGRQRICSCEALQGSPGLVLVEGGRPVMAWPAPVQHTRGQEPSSVHGTAMDFEVVQADMDGDGRREHVVAFRREANDVGMSWWNLAVLSGAQPQAPPLLLTAANYGEGSLIRSAGSGGCDLLSTTWELAWEPGRDISGWTLLGRPMQYRGGSLGPLRDRPIYARRLYNSFQPGTVTRPGGLEVGTPLQDLVHHKAHQRVVEPAAQAWRLDESPVSIVGAQPRLDPALGVVPDLSLEREGHRWQLQWRSWNQGFEALGDKASGRLYPPGYRPADTAWPAGRQATLASYAGMYGSGTQLVWLTP